jgi:hypothetical protein
VAYQSFYLNFIFFRKSCVYIMELQAIREAMETMAKRQEDTESKFQQLLSLILEEKKEFR